MSKTVLHIGANKTASTTLQRCLFPYAKGLVYLGEDCEGYEDIRAVMDSMVFDDDLHSRWEDAKKIFADYKDKVKEDETFLYSNEDIMTSRVPSQIAKRMKELLPDAEIVLVIRNQMTAVTSMYANHGAYLRGVPRNYFHRYVSFDQWMNHTFNFMNYSLLDSYFYNQILELYEELFGKDKIHILFFEDFVKNKEKFVGQLSDVLNIDKDEALKLLGNKVERRRNTMREYNYHKFRGWFFPSISFSKLLPLGGVAKDILNKFLEGGPSASGFMTKKWEEKIFDLYKEDNARLAKKYNLPLKEYGYPIE